MTDSLMRRHGAMRFSWGGSPLDAAGTTRQIYIRALRQAGAHKVEPLIQFVRYL